MNIAVYSHYFSPEIGAPSARIHDLGRRWIARGHQVQVATCFPNHPHGKPYSGYDFGWSMREGMDGIEVLRHWTYVAPNKGFIKKTLGHASYCLGTAAFTDRRIVAPDVVIGTSPTLFAAQAASFLARKRRIPFIMEVRDLWPAIFVELGVLKNRRIIHALEHWEKSLYRKATRIVTVTEAFRRNLIERSIPAEKVVTIPNGADDEFWQPAPRPLDLEKLLGLEGSFVVLYIGAHGISQALGKLLDSAALLRDRPEIKFLFVGDGAEKQDLIKRADEMKLSNVRFLDPVDKVKVKDFYALADACLIPLRDIPLFDSFIPSKMFEILSMSRPIIASLRGEAADILRRSGGASVVGPEDSRAVADAILDIYRDREGARVMGEKGRAFVRAEYSRRALGDRYLDLMTDAIAAYNRNNK